MRSSSSWANLVEKGGSQFIQQLTELHFQLLLYSAQSSLHLLKASLQEGKHVSKFGDIVDSNLQEAFILSEDLSLGEVVSGGVWQPSDTQIAKLYFMQAQCWRLMDRYDTREEALHFIEMADELVLNDVEIGKEKRKMVDWVDDLNEMFRDELD
jgi:hypothetical protein